MSNSDETLKKTPENDAVLQAIAELSKKFDKLENFVTVQSEAIREGIEYNSARDDRLEAKFYEVRSDVSNMRADIKELAQAVRKREVV